MADTRAASYRLARRHNLFTGRIVAGWPEAPGSGQRLDPRVVKIAVAAALFSQGSGRAVLDDPPRVDHEHAIGDLNG